MRNINLKDDIGAPLAVTAANLAVRSWKPAWEEYMVYGITLAGFVGAYMNWGGNFVKNIGIAELPLAAEKVYDRIRGLKTSSTTSRVALGRVSRYPAPPAASNFGGARMV